MLAQWTKRQQVKQVVHNNAAVPVTNDDQAWSLCRSAGDQGSIRAAGSRFLLLANTLDGEPDDVEAFHRL